MPDLSRYDGRTPEPPYETPSTEDIQAQHIEALKIRIEELEAESDMTRKGDRWWTPNRLKDCRQDERKKVLNTVYQVLCGFVPTETADKAINRAMEIIAAD